MNTKESLISSFRQEKCNDLRISIAMEFNKLFVNSDKVERITNVASRNTDCEFWANVIGFEGVYQISSYGRVKSVERFFVKNKKGGKEKMAVYVPGKIRVIGNNPNGYPTAALWLNGKAKHYIVHRLVAIHFLPNPNNHPQVLHMDDNPGNPHITNLEWGTQKKNIQDCVSRGRWHIGIKNNKTKLKHDDIPKIRQLLIDKIPSRKIAALFGVQKSAILSIAHNKTWSHIK